MICEATNNGQSFSTLQSIWNVIGSDGDYYFQADNYLTTFWNQTHNGFVKGTDQDFRRHISDPTNPMLNKVTFVDALRYHPGENQDISNIATGDDTWLHDIVEEIGRSIFASSTVVVITFDEGGGFFDHVPPPRVPTVAKYIDTNAPFGVPPDEMNNVPLGFRVPAIIVSPFGPRFIDTLQYEHSSVLKMIEWAFNYRQISPGPSGPPRDAADDRYVSNLACALNFGSVNFLRNAGFEVAAPLSAGVPGWVSNGNTAAVAETWHPHSGRQNAICSTNGFDCKIYQDVTAPKRGLQNYTLSFYAAASLTPSPKSDGSVGVDASGTVSMPVVADGIYHLYTMTVSAFGGTPIRVWMYAGTRQGWVAIDDVKLAPQ